jgi:FOG: TPR repeat
VNFQSSSSSSSSSSSIHFIRIANALVRSGGSPILHFAICSFQFSIRFAETLPAFLRSRFKVRGSRFKVSAFLHAWIALFFFSLSLPCSAADPSSAFDAANKLYYGGKFTDAIAAYENILYSGQKSVALYYNLGNAYFKSGQIGKAIAFYREAKNLTPRDPDIRANLQFARNQIQGPTLAPGRAQRVLSKLTLNEWTLLAAAALWLCFVILALRQWRPTLKRPLQLYFSAAAIATILLFGCVAISWLENRSTRTAIVISRDVPVRRGPLEESAAAFTVHDGSELRVLDQNNEWLQVTTDPSRIGWLRRDQVLLSPQT